VDDQDELFLKKVPRPSERPDRPSSMEAQERQHSSVPIVRGDWSFMIMLRVMASDEEAGYRL
jgi:hypothetical protein